MHEYICGIEMDRNKKTYGGCKERIRREVLKRAISKKVCYGCIHYKGFNEEGKYRGCCNSICEISGREIMYFFVEGCKNFKRRILKE